MLQSDGRAEVLRDGLSGAGDIVVVIGAGHASNLSHPDQVNGRCAPSSTDSVERGSCLHGVGERQTDSAERHVDEEPTHNRRGLMRTLQRGLIQGAIRVARRWAWWAENIEAWGSHVGLGRARPPSPGSPIAWHRPRASGRPYPTDVDRRTLPPPFAPYLS